MFSSIQERLEKESQYSPMKILQIPMTKDVGISLVTGIISLTASMIQNQYKIFS